MTECFSQTRFSCDDRAPLVFVFVSSFLCCSSSTSSGISPLFLYVACCTDDAKICSSIFHFPMRWFTANFFWSISICLRLLWIIYRFQIEWLEIFHIRVTIEDHAMPRRAIQHLNYYYKYIYYGILVNMDLRNCGDAVKSSLNIEWILKMIEA